jgi:hypothetical protein
MGERKDLRDLLKDKDFTQKRIIDDLASSDAEDDYPRRGVSGDIRRSDGGDFIKNFFVGILLVVIVVGSFWASFLIGKKVLVPPIKNFPSLETPEPKALSNSDMEKAAPLSEEPAVEEKEIKEVQVKAGIPKPVSLKKVLTAKKIRPSESGKLAAVKKTVKSPKAVPPKTVNVQAAKTKGAKFYKVIVGTFKTGDEAASFVRSLKEKGFTAYVKVLSGLYRVQTGAFDSREKANPLVAKLESKGIIPSVIVE